MTSEQEARDFMIEWLTNQTAEGNREKAQDLRQWFNDHHPDGEAALAREIEQLPEPVRDAAERLFFGQD